jgi:hypothetical protein
MQNLLDDTAPQLGGMLDINANAIGDGTRELITFIEDASAVNHINIENEATGGGPIISAVGDDANVDLNLVAKGTGDVKVGVYTFDGDQSVGVGQDNYVLTYDNGTGLISLEVATGGGDAWTDAVDSDILPTGNDATYDLGGSGARFVDGWLTGSLVFADSADHSQTPTTGLHQLWVRTSDNKLIYTDEAGTDTDLTAAGGGDLWSDPVDAVITPDVHNTRDLATTGTRFADGYFEGTVYCQNIYGPSGEGNIRFNSSGMLFYHDFASVFDLEDGGAGSAKASIPSDWYFGWSQTTAAAGTPDVKLHRDASNTLALRNTTNAQALRVYNTDDGTQTNTEYGGLVWDTNVLEIGSFTTGTGVARNVVLQRDGTTKITIDSATTTSANDFNPASDATLDLGASGASWLDIWMDGSIIFNDRADHSETPAVGLHQLWVRSSDNKLIFTDEAGTDTDITAGAGGGDAWTDAVDSDILPTGADNTYDLGGSGARFVDGWLTGGLIFNDRADHSQTPTTGLHQLWVRTSDNKLIYTDESGTDTDLTSGGGGGAGKNSYWIPAAAMKSRVTNGAAWGSEELATNDRQIGYYSFDPSTEEGVQFDFAMPEGWDEGTITAKFVWTHPTTTTNFGVVWDIAGVALSDGDALDTAVGTVQTATDTGGTTDDHYISPETSAVTIAGTPAAGDTVFYEITRVAGDGSDTMAVDARLLGVRLYFTRDSLTD